MFKRLDINLSFPTDLWNSMLFHGEVSFSKEEMKQVHKICHLMNIKEFLHVKGTNLSCVLWSVFKTCEILPVALRARNPEEKVALTKIK